METGCWGLRYCIGGGAQGIGMGMGMGMGPRFSQQGEMGWGDKGREPETGPWRTAVDRASNAVRYSCVTSVLSKKFLEQAAEATLACDVDPASVGVVSWAAGWCWASAPRQRRVEAGGGCGFCRELMCTSGNDAGGDDSSAHRCDFGPWGLFVNRGWCDWRDWRTGAGVHIGKTFGACLRTVYICCDL